MTQTTPNTKSKEFIKIMLSSSFMYRHICVEASCIGLHNALLDSAGLGGFHGHLTGGG